MTRKAARDRIDVILEQWARERPEVDTLAMGVVGRVQRAAQALRPRLDAVQTKFGLVGESFDVLAALRRSGEPYRLTPTQLYEQLMLSSGAMTNRIDRLVEARLVERRPDPSDGRGSLVCLTPSGRKLIDRALKAHAENETALLSVLSKKEQTELTELLKQLLVSWDDVEEP